MQFGNIHQCDTPTIVFLKDRSIIELDFVVHIYSRPTALFLKKGQYFKIIDGSPVLFPLNNEIDLNHYRYLFSHLTGIGHVLFEKEKLFEPDLEKSLDNWRKMNPFNANESQLDLLFDTNEFFETNPDATLPVSEAIPAYRQLNQISSRHINHSLHEWKTYKLIVQAKYLLFFAGKSIQEVAYELRFKDPSYFGRFFKRITHQTPGEFLQINEDRPSRNVLMNQLKDLIENNYRSQHFIQFYADQLYMTPKNLAEKVKREYGVSVKALIKNRLFKEARKLKNVSTSVSDISHMLGFREVSHFSAFYSRMNASQSENTTSKEIFVNS